MDICYGLLGRLEERGYDGVITRGIVVGVEYHGGHLVLWTFESMRLVWLV